MSRTLLFVSSLLIVGAVSYWTGEHSWKVPAPPRPVDSPIEAPALEGARVAELGRVLRMAPGPDRLVEARDLFDGLEPARFADVIEVFRGELVEANDPAYAMMAEWYAAHDPRAAFEWSFRGWRRGNPFVLEAVVRQWVAEDPVAAGSAVDAIQIAEARHYTRNALVRAWYRSGQPGLENYVLRLQAGGDRQIALGQLIHMMGHLAGIEATIRWADGIPNGDPEFKLDAFRRVAGTAAAIDPEAASLFAARHGEGESGAALYRRVGTAWAEKPGAAPAAMAWLESLPEGPRRDVAVSETYRVWLARDRDAALDYCAERGFTGWLEPVSALYLMASARRDPEWSVAQIAKIEDPKRQREATIGVGRAWIRDDPEAARAWMARAALPDDIRGWIEETVKGAAMPEETAGEG